MSYQLTQDPNTVLRLSDCATVPRFHRFWDEYEQWLAAGGVPLPVAEVDLNSQERVWRDTQIESIKWLRERHRDELDLTLPTTLNSAQFAQLLAYFQQLREWPQTSDFPATSLRPTAPDWIAAQV